MCLGLPGKVVEVRPDGVAIVEYSGGLRSEADARTVDNVKPGDVVIVHAGIIISVIDEEEAKRQLEFLEEFISDLERKAEQLLP
ncbi:MAG: HypC/HybG/HupF family hydrogenase formation chaperone [Desulfurococcales archaeon]|nr:HypC/HybG/HupF family hydrogenase formation chaperone [Desulfurococcales archaeon]